MLMPAGIGGVDHLLLVEDDGLACLDHQHFGLDLLHGSDGSEAHGRNVEAQILGRLADLDDHRALVAELSAADDRGIGAIDAFHGQHRLVLDHQALAHVQMSEAFSQLPAEGNVVILAPVWLATRQDPFGGEERG